MDNSLYIVNEMETLALSCQSFEELVRRSNGLLQETRGPISKLSPLGRQRKQYYTKNCVGEEEQ